eukprot:scaffold225093_cov68-Attheya_sp.AAC.3
MMDTAKKTLPRNKGNGWDVQKYHEMFHLTHYMVRYGSPMNFDSGTGEKFHTFNAKMPAATVQLQSQEKFQFQSSSQRYGRKRITLHHKCMLSHIADAESENKRESSSDIFPISPLVVLNCLPISDNDEDDNGHPVINTIPLESIDIHVLVILECPKLDEKKGHSEDAVHIMKPRYPACWVSHHFTR